MNLRGESGKIKMENDLLFKPAAESTEHKHIFLSAFLFLPSSELSPPHIFKTGSSLEFDAFEGNSGLFIRAHHARQLQRDETKT